MLTEQLNEIRVQIEKYDTLDFNDKQVLALSLESAVHYCRELLPAANTAASIEQAFREGGIFDFGKRSLYYAPLTDEYIVYQPEARMEQKKLYSGTDFPTAVQTLLKTESEDGK